MSFENRVIARRTFGVFTQVSLLALALPLTSCKKQEQATPQPSIAEYASPEDAGEALLTAARSDDPEKITTVFGSGSKEILSSGDSIQDKSQLKTFAAAYDTMHRWRPMIDGTETLIVGADNFPFAVPLRKNAAGKWSFDTAAGKEEVLSRRIGRNELAAIESIKTVEAAQGEYFRRPHDENPSKLYAQKFISDPGKQNGLYWSVEAGQPQSPLGPLAAFATTEGYSDHPDQKKPFHGYLFRMLTSQSASAPFGAKQYLVNGKMTGGFAVVAYPAEYGNSGVMTFIINQDGLLLQKDLGKATAETAAAMTVFDPGIGWDPVEN
jgi:hypothetical protein